MCAIVSPIITRLFFCLSQEDEMESLLLQHEQGFPSITGNKNWALISSIVNLFICFKGTGWQDIVQSLDPGVDKSFMFCLQPRLALSLTCHFFVMSFTYPVTSLSCSVHVLSCHVLTCSWPVLISPVMYLSCLVPVLSCQCPVFSLLCPIPDPVMFMSCHVLVLSTHALLWPCPIHVLSLHCPDKSLFCHISVMSLSVFLMSCLVPVLSTVQSYTCHVLFNLFRCFQGTGSQESNTLTQLISCFIRQLPPITYYPFVVKTIYIISCGPNVNFSKHCASPPFLRGPILGVNIFK